MAKVYITNVVVLDNPTNFLNPLQFELTFECIEELKEDLEWKMIYVGSAESEQYDQVLDTIYVGPVPEGRHIFVFQADPPDVARIPEQDVVGVTIVLLTCSYRGQEFVRVGYFINNDYSDPELRENPPTKPIFEKLTRNILASKPRVTRFKINWDDAPTNAPPGIDPEFIAEEQAAQQARGEEYDDELMGEKSSTMAAEGGNGNSMLDDNSLNLPDTDITNGLNESSISMEC